MKLGKFIFMEGEMENNHKQEKMDTHSFLNHKKKLEVRV